MTETPFYKLKKPGDNEFYDIVVANENVDKIDTALSNKADKTPPVEYDLPLASGFVSIFAKASYYSKDQVGRGGLNICASGTIQANTVTDVAVLPAGFRPASVVNGVAYSYNEPQKRLTIWAGYDGLCSVWSEQSITGGIAGSLSFVCGN